MATVRRRVGQTKDGATPLLRTVNGRRHAQDQDHEETQQKESTLEEGLRIPKKKKRRALSNDDVTGPPLSSDDEPARGISNIAEENGLKKPPTSTRKRKAELSLPERDPEPGLRKPAPKKTRNAPRAPQAGQFEQSRAAKAALNGDKENKNGTHTPPTSSGDVWGFGLSSSQTSQKGPKVTFGGGNKTRNIHTAPSSAKKANRGPVKFGSKSNRKPEPYSDVGEADDGDDEQFETLSAKERDDDLLGSSDLDLENPKPADPELRRVPPKRKKPAIANGDGPESTGMDDAELDNILKPTLREQLGLQNTQDSSLPPSSAPQEDMDNIDSYVRQLPAEAEEGTACPICNEPVEQDYYWEFWKGRRNTVKNQAAFCHTDRKAAAQKAYLTEGYPTKDGIPFIDWPNLPLRIKQHRMILHKILIGDTTSAHRTRYE